jgi:hypothetical protein
VPPLLGSPPELGLGIGLALAPDLPASDDPLPYEG